MKYFLSLSLSLTLTLSALCTIAAAQTDTAHYKVYATATGTEVPLSHIIEAMAHADVLFFGEEHNDSAAHQLQLEILDMLSSRYPEHTALSLEMFDRDVQHIMDEYLRGDIREKHFLRDARPWSNYKDYRPLVETARERNLPVVCANAPTRYTNLAGRKGQKALRQLSREARRALPPLPYREPDGAYRAKLMDFMGLGHSSSDSTAHDPAAHFGGFDLLAAQSLWDAAMAWSVAQHLKKHPNAKVLHINGRFHSDEGHAVATQLHHYRKKARQLIISCGPAEDFHDPQWQQYKHLGDFIILTDPDLPRSY